MADRLDNQLQVEWGREQIPLRKWKDSMVPLPSIVKLEGLDQSHMLPRLPDEKLLLHSIINHKKVICQCVDFASKDGQFYFSSQTFSIPIAYQGWFEILSEDGKTIAPCKSIQEVADQNPNTFLVRSRVKAYLSDREGEPNYSQTRTVEKGEVMTMVGSMHMTYGWRKQKKKILHCIDPMGLDIYLDLKTTGQFSPMAGPANISGVHSIEGLISQFRLPLTVRIVCGQVPKVSTQNGQPGIFRLMEIQKDNTALFLPIQQSQQKLIPVSTRTNGLSFTPCCNMSQLNDIPFLQSLMQLANEKVEKYSKTMQVLVSAKQLHRYSVSTLPTRNKQQIGLAKLANSEKTTTGSKLTEEDILFAEVDDLYAYVRRGGVPPKPRPRSWATNMLDKSVTAAVSVSTDNMSSSQPILSTNGKPRGLLATLTAGRFPSKRAISSLVRGSYVPPDTPSNNQYTTEVLSSTQHTTTHRSDGLPNRRDRFVAQCYASRHKGSEESLQTDIDPYITENDQHYANLEAIEFSRRISGHVRQKSADGAISANYSEPFPKTATDMDSSGNKATKSLHADHFPPPPSLPQTLTEP